MATLDEFLAPLRRSGLKETPRPSLAGLGARFADPAEKFAEVLASVGGACARVPDLAAANEALSRLDVYRAAKRVATLVPGVGEGNVRVEAVADPHELEGLDVAVLRGELAVAENGAVWVEGGPLHHRVVFVVPEHLVLVVDSREVVNDMHEAYARLASREVGYGTFISGPSKTADIEQSLVIGAQGARSCTVLLVG